MATCTLIQEQGRIECTTDLTNIFFHAATFSFNVMCHSDGGSGKNKNLLIFLPICRHNDVISRSFCGALIIFDQFWPFWHLAAGLRLHVFSVWAQFNFKNLFSFWYFIPFLILRWSFWQSKKIFLSCLLMKFDLKTLNGSKCS